MKLRYKIAAVIGVAALGTSGSIAYSALSKPQYILSANPAVELSNLALTADTITGTQLRGIPDGMGAYKNDKGGISLLTVHEVPSYSALAQQSKSDSAIWGVSITKMNISPNTKKVTSASDFIKQMSFYNYTTDKYQDTPIGGAPAGTTKGFDWNISRFCSATLVQAGKLSYTSGGKTFGYDGPIFLSGEEDGDSGYGRGFAFDMNGNGIQLPRMGVASWENLMPNLKPGMNTVVMGNEDGSAADSQLFMYVGTKTNTGTFADKAGLTNGDLHVLSIPDIANDTAFRNTYGKNKAVEVKFNKTIWNDNMANQQKDHAAQGTELSRVEDGEWDPNNPNVFYFVTTESSKFPTSTKPNPATPTVSRDGGALWRLTFVDGQNPTLGAKLEMLLDGSEAPYLSKPDNITITHNGLILIQEDPGGNDAVSRIVAFRPSDSKLAVIAEFNKDYFQKGAANFMTNDEESSGIIEATNLFAKKGDTNSYYLFNTQIHTAGAAAARPDLAHKSTTAKAAIDKHTLEGGGWYIMTVSSWDDVFK
jgi:hypothetical protein